MKFQFESLDMNYHIQKVKSIKYTIEAAMDNPGEALKSIWTGEKPDSMVKKHSLLAAFTALFVTAPLEIKEIHLKMLQSEFGIIELEDICDILSKKLQSRLPKAA